MMIGNKPDWEFESYMCEMVDVHSVTVNSKAMKVVVLNYIIKVRIDSGQKCSLYIRVRRCRKCCQMWNVENSFQVS